MEKNNKKQNVVIIFLVVIILILVGLFAMFYLKNQDNKINVNESVKEEKNNNKKEIISEDKYDEYERLLRMYTSVSQYNLFNKENINFPNEYLVNMAYANTQKTISVDISKEEKDTNDETAIGKSYKDLQDTVDNMFYKKFTLKKESVNSYRYVSSSDAFVDVLDLGYGYGYSGAEAMKILNIEKYNNQIDITAVETVYLFDISDKNGNNIKFNYDEKNKVYTIEGNKYNSVEEFIGKYPNRFNNYKFVFILDGPTYKLSHLEKIN